MSAIDDAIDKLVADTTAAAAPKNVNVSVPSTVVTLKVTDAPVTLEVTPPAAGKPGTTLEVPLKPSVYQRSSSRGSPCNPP